MVGDGVQLDICLCHCSNFFAYSVQLAGGIWTMKIDKAIWALFILLFFFYQEQNKIFLMVFVRLFWWQINRRAEFLNIFLGFSKLIWAIVWHYGKVLGANQLQTTVNTIRLYRSVESVECIVQYCCREINRQFWGVQKRRHPLDFDAFSSAQWQLYMRENEKQ